MRIATSSISDTIVRQIQQLSSQQARLQNQVATGQRIFEAEDDPSSVGRVLNLATEQRQLTQYVRNTDRALEISQATFSGLQGLKKISDRATELGTLGAGAATGEAIQAYASEVDQLIEQTLQLGNSKLGNDHLFAGTAVDTPPFAATRDAAGRITAVAFVGNDGQTAIPLSASSTVSPGATHETNLGTRDFLNHLVALRDAFAASDSPAVTAAQTGLIATEDGFVSALGESGGVQTRIEASKAQNTDLATSLESLISKETDADLPSTVVKLNQTQTAYQAALQSAAKIMRLSLLDYIN
ncbi:MAG: flagellin [Verrucomicrobia bacterium]|nr:flagellin [Verrucomicrobiota bacterium]